MKLIIGKKKPKERRITPAEAGKAMAAYATNYRDFVEDFAKHGKVNELEAWGLNIFCVTFGIRLATHGRLSPIGEHELFESFHRTTYQVAIRALTLDNDGYEAFLRWIARKFEEYDPHAQRYFYQGDKNEFDLGSVIVKNLLNREKDVLTALLVFHPAIRRIVSTAKAFNKIQLIH
jgi:hypothetical protein